MSLLEKKESTIALSLLWDRIPEIGQHVGKQCNSWAESISFYHDMRQKRVPVQIFTGSPQSYARKPFPVKDRDALIAMHKSDYFPFFVHSAYIINLCRDLEEKQLNYIKNEFEISKSIDAEGVVFHVGKSLKMDINVALKSMKDNIINCVINYASSECPFLLETPAGQGSETLVDFEAFTSFYQDIIDELPIEHKDKFKVCIDTCHIFAANHDPETYITRWLEENDPDSLALVHFNDSQGVCGCFVDRHQEPGTGRIGPEKLSRIYQILVNCNIPAVYE